MFAVFTAASQNIQNATGPIDDGYITNVVGALPGDALCCAGPEPLDDGMSLGFEDLSIYIFRFICLWY